MGRLKTRNRKKNSGATELSELKEELHRVKEQLEARDQQLETSNLQLAEGLEQQTATSEILRMIASAPADLQSVMDTIARTAARLCNADDVLVRRIDGDTYQLVAHFGSIPTTSGIGVKVPIARDTPAGRAVADRQTIHVHDLRAAEAEFPRAKIRGIAVGVRTALVAPLLRAGNVIGTIHIRRRDVRPFTEKQIKLLETFADQAVIAIENVRLFQELQSRNRDLSEALEQQTATSEILRVIASSPNDLTPVLEIVAKNAARLCEASSAQVFRADGDVLRLAVNYGELTSRETRPINRDTVAGRAFVDRRTVHVHHPEQSTAEFSESMQAAHQTRLATPLLRDNVALGVIGIRRTDMRPFTESQIKLVETFADQAVIAIENVRLFKELQDRNRQLTEVSGAADGDERSA
jgi:GAF domain-containing protein